MVKGKGRLLFKYHFGGQNGGRVIDSLKENNLYENTIIIFTSRSWRDDGRS